MAISPCVRPWRPRHACSLSEALVREVKTEEDVVARTAGERATILDRFGARTLLVFGSAARGDLEDDSDVDVLVEFEGPATFDRFMGLKLHLEDLLGRPVDLTPKALPPSLHSTVQREGRRVA